MARPKTIKTTDTVWDNFKSKYIDNNALTKLRTNKLSTMYNTAKNGMKKPLDKATKADIEKFIEALNKDELVKEDGNPFSGSTKSDIKKFIRLFYKWLRGDGMTFPAEVAWIKTRIPKDQKPKKEDILSQADVVKLAKSYNRPEYQALIYLLYDSGFRIDEMRSVTKQDITWEDYGTDKCWWIKCNRSKTFTRKIEVPIFTDEISAFMNTTYMKTLKASDLIWPTSYNALKTNMMKHASQVFHRKIHFHLFRHSSATFYAEHYNGDMLKLCCRLGWSLAAEEAKIYVRMSGASQKLAASVSYNQNLRKLNEKVEAQNDEISDLRSQLAKMARFMSIIEKNPDILKEQKLIEVVKKKQR